MTERQCWRCRGVGAFRTNLLGEQTMKSIGYLILMGVLCIMVFFVFMAMRPAPAMAQQTPIYGPDGKYQGSVFNYGRTQTYTDRNGHFSGSAINNGNGTTSYYRRNGNFSGSSIDRAFNFNRR